MYNRKEPALWLQKQIYNYKSNLSLIRDCTAMVASIMTSKETGINEGTAGSKTCASSKGGRGEFQVHMPSSEQNTSNLSFNIYKVNEV